MPKITIFHLGLLIMGVITILITIRSAKDMTDRALLKSKSLVRLLGRLARRHWLALIVVLAVMVLMFATLKLLGLIVDLILTGRLLFKANWHVDRYRHHVAYIRAIWPRFASRWLPVKLNRIGGDRLGGQNISYVFLNRHRKTLTFPEATAKDSQSYYLLGIRFRPAYGPRYNRLTYRRPFTIKDHGYGSANLVEIPSTAVVKLLSTDFSRVTQVHLYNEISNVVNRLRSRYRLNAADKRELGIF